MSQGNLRFDQLLFSQRSVGRGISQRRLLVVDGGVQSVETDAVAQHIRDGMPGARVEVTGDGSHFEAVVVSDLFVGKSLIQRQRMVMDTVRQQIASGELHALSIKTMTPEQRSQKAG